MIYRVTKKFDTRGGAGIEVGSYNSIELAKAAIFNYLAEDARLSIKAMYSIFEGYDELETYDQSILDDITTSSKEVSAQQQSQGKSQRFSPTPLSMRLRAPGTMPSSYKDDEDDT